MVVYFMIPFYLSRQAKIYATLCQYCKQINMDLILKCAMEMRIEHHMVWGTSDTNYRERESNFEILNKGHSPTLVTSRKQEIIDISTFILYLYILFSSEILK